MKSYSLKNDERLEQNDDMRNNDMRIAPGAFDATVMLGLSGVSVKEGRRGVVTFGDVVLVEDVEAASSANVPQPKATLRVP